MATVVFADPQHVLIRCYGEESTQLRCDIVSVLMCTDISLDHILFYYFIYYGCTAFPNTIIQHLLNKDVPEKGRSSVQSSFFRPSPLLT